MTERLCSGVADGKLEGKKTLSVMAGGSSTDREWEGKFR